MNKRRIIFLMLSCLWMGVIFFYSSRNAEVSTGDSYKVGLAVGHIFVPGFDNKSDEAQIEFAKKIDHPVRKMAHATEYAILGMLLVGVFYSDDDSIDKNKKMIRNLLCPIICTACYAASDEIHQTFVLGRSGMASDVLLDSCGACVGVIILLMLIRLVRRKRYT